MLTHKCQLPDGRQLAYLELGDPEGYPVVFFHGGPGSRLDALFFASEAGRQGFRLIAPDRPGQGQSDYYPDRTLLSDAADTEALADALGLHRLSVMGWSGGGPPTLAAAFSLKDKVDAAVTLAGFVCPDFEGAAELLNKADALAAELAHKSPLVFRSFFKAMSLAEKYAPEMFYNTLLKAVGQADRTLLEDATVKCLIMASQKEAVVNGVDGIAQDARLDYEPDWGFKLSDIEIPVHIFQGTEDTLVARQFGEHAAKVIPGSTLHLLLGKGHMFPIDNQKDLWDILGTALKKLEVRF